MLKAKIFIHKNAKKTTYEFADLSEVANGNLAIESMPMLLPESMSIEYIKASLNVSQVPLKAFTVLESCEMWLYRLVPIEEVIIEENAEETEVNIHSFTAACLFVKGKGFCDIDSIFNANKKLSLAKLPAIFEPTIKIEEFAQHLKTHLKNSGASLSIALEKLTHCHIKHYRLEKILEQT